MSSNITVIIPVHEYNDIVSSYLDKAIKSILEQKETKDFPEILIVSPVTIEKDVNGYIKNLKNELNVKLVSNENEANYQTQVNEAIKNVNTEYFSVLEYDDEYSTTYFKNLKKYIDSYNNIDIFMPIIIEVNNENQGLKFTNEIIWSQQFVGENGEMGFLNQNVLKQFSDFKLSGAVIKKTEFENIGKYKSKIKLTFMYELLLRALNNGCKIFTIPKIGYKHLATREGSLFDSYMKNMSMNERKFWFDVAIRESNFMADREIDTTKISGSIVVDEK